MATIGDTSPVYQLRTPADDGAIAMDFGPPQKAQTPQEDGDTGSVAPFARPEHAQHHSVQLVDPTDRISVSDFYAYMPMHNYIFAPTGEIWPSASVNSRIAPIAVGAQASPASRWLDQNRPVEQMTWCPGEPQLIKNRLISNGGWIERDGVAIFNLYRPPTIKHGDPAKAKPWINHIFRVYPDGADHIISWFAQRVQRPGEKINHSLVLGGAQGTGKDTMLEPVKRAVGPWNCGEVSPTQLLGRFNSFVKSVILRVSEARDLGDVDRFAFYDHTKVYAASPPDTLRCDEKNLREYQVLNVVGLIITTNYKADGVFLPPDDRRHFVAWSELTKDDFNAEYWTDLWRWFEDGGCEHVAAYLAEYDLSGFDAKAPPPKTTAFWDIVDANRATEDAELRDAGDLLGNPLALTINDIVGHSGADLQDWLKDRKNSRRIPHRLEEIGYVKARNKDASDGLWRIAGKRQAIYVRKEMSVRDRAAAARYHYEKMVI